MTALPHRVTQWTAAPILDGLDKDELRFPKGCAPITQPVIVRNPACPKKAVVAPSYVETTGQSEDITTSSSILRQLGLQGTAGNVEYRTATLRDIVAAKKWTLIGAILACALAVAAIVLGVAAIYPDNPTARCTAWVAGGVGVLVALAICVIAIHSAYHGRAE